MSQYTLANSIKLESQNDPANASWFSRIYCCASFNDVGTEDDNQLNDLGPLAKNYKQVGHSRVPSTISVNYNDCNVDEQEEEQEGLLSLEAREVYSLDATDNHYLDSKIFLNPM